MKKNCFKIFSAAIYIIAMVLLTIIAVPLLKTYDNPESFSALIDSFGAFGIIIMILLQVAQIIVALIPGEIIEFVSGTLYGWLGGLVICLLGIAIGQCIVFIAVRFFGESLVERAAGSDFMHKFKFLHDEKRLKALLFILYFIPGTPKDIITYIVPVTKVNLIDFLIISILARIPSVVSSTYAGDAFAEMDYKSLIIVYSVVICISIGGALLYRYWQSKHKYDDSHDNLHQTKNDG